jgi:hypothetical protein
MRFRLASRSLIRGAPSPIKDVSKWLRSWGKKRERKAPRA